jgi:hypothetical protein
VEGPVYGDLIVTFEIVDDYEVDAFGFPSEKHRRQWETKNVPNVLKEDPIWRAEYDKSGNSRFWSRSDEVGPKIRLGMECDDDEFQGVEVTTTDDEYVDVKSMCLSFTFIIIWSI